jgi:hypothetical protein
MSRPVYNDSEQGTLEVRSPQSAANPDLTKGEKKPVDIDVFLVQSLKKDAPVSPSNAVKPQPPKPQKMKISKYVHFIIWYNSYKLVLSYKPSTRSLIALEAVFHSHLHTQLHRLGLRCRWSLAIRP